VGTPLDLYDTPANVFVAQFIGTPNMNVMNMDVSEDGTKLVSECVTFNTPDGWKEGVEARKGKKVVVGIRPEYVREGEEHEWTNVAVLKGKVSIIETLGHEVVVHFVVAGEEKPFIAKMDVHRTPTVGSDVEFHVNVDKLHIFDAETQERL
jgi:multiple sugar transport system ATP-binding protein